MHSEIEMDRVNGNAKNEEEEIENGGELVVITCLFLAEIESHLG
jgi:hypothetical protein